MAGGRDTEIACSVKRRLLNGTESFNSNAVTGSGWSQLPAEVRAVPDRHPAKAISCRNELAGWLRGGRNAGRFRGHGRVEEAEAQLHFVLFKWESQMVERATGLHAIPVHRGAETGAGYDSGAWVQPARRFDWLEIVPLDRAEHGADLPVSGARQQFRRYSHLPVKSPSQRGYIDMLPTKVACQEKDRPVTDIAFRERLLSVHVLRNDEQLRGQTESVQGERNGVRV